MKGKRGIVCIIFLFTVFGCYKNRYLEEIKAIDVSRIVEVEITKQKDKNTLRIKDKGRVVELFSDFIFSSKWEPVKFYPAYRIYFSIDEKIYLFLVSGNYFKYNGRTFHSDKNIEKFAASHFK